MRWHMEEENGEEGREKWSSREGGEGGGGKGGFTVKKSLTAMENNRSPHCNSVEAGLVAEMTA